MKWTVVWVGNSEDELTTIWMQAEDRNSITQASNRIERELRVNADQKGEDFYGDRIFVYGPLAVVYELWPDDCQVRIVQVSRIKG